MEGDVLGLIVAGGGGPLASADAALTPFAGKYRFVDFALATLRNSGVGDVHVCAPAGGGRSSTLRTHLARTQRGRRAVVPLSSEANGHGSRAGRILQALRACGELVRARRPMLVAVLSADHILQLDLRQLAEAHAAAGADVTLAALPVPIGEATARTVLHIDAERRVQEVQHAPRTPAAAPGCPGFALGWAGDLVISAAALPALLDALPAEPLDDDAALLGPLAEACRLVAFDVLESRMPGAPHGRGAYWHEPTSLEAYYDAQMDLCRPRPALDLYNPAWPLPLVATGLAPAKVTADAAGRAGQALNALVSDGSVIRGGVVINSVLGHGVVVDSGAEVEDSILLDGCRIGVGARVRRAVVGPGAVVGDGGQIGYDAVPPAPAHVARSGLTLVPGTAGTA